MMGKVAESEPISDNLIEDILRDQEGVKALIKRLKIM
jgi:hypothetical protein